MATQRTLALALASFGAALGCGADARNTAGERLGTAPPRVLSAVLADTVWYQDDLLGSAFLQRIVVRADGFTDTLAGVLSLQNPLIAGDSAVFGVGYDQGYPTDGFLYVARTRQLQRLPFPEPLLPGTVPTFALDARHLAYVAADSQGFAHPVVLSWPERHVVLRGPTVSLLETDAGVDVVRWVDHERVEVQIDLSMGESVSARTMVWSGNVRTRDGSTDTIPRPVQPVR